METAFGVPSWDRRQPSAARSTGNCRRSHANAMGARRSTFSHRRDCRDILPNRSETVLTSIFKGPSSLQKHSQCFPAKLCLRQSCAPNLTRPPAANPLQRTSEPSKLLWLWSYLKSHPFEYGIFETRKPKPTVNLGGSERVDTHLARARAADHPLVAPVLLSAQLETALNLR